MKVRKSTEDLYRIQEEIASKASLTDEVAIEKLKIIAGADQAFFYDSEPGEKLKTEKIISAVVLLEYPSLQFIDYSYSVMSVDFPYVPGLLSFREAPAILNAFHVLKNKPDLFVIDGGGINHPRFAGLATHVGVTADIPTIGVTKKLLCGTGKLPTEEGESCIITYREKAVGYYLKSKKGSKPIIVAPGHKVSLETSLELIKTCIRKHKLPEPTRVAHLCANKIKRDRL
jgi:deoxyribonuclease V